MTVRSRSVALARGLWRSARGFPLVGAALRGVDRVWWARTIRGAGIVDERFVAAQTGRSMSPRRAVRAYVRGGFRAGLRLNPLFCDDTASRQLPDADRVPALYAYLVNDPRGLSISPHWDAAALAASLPAGTNPLRHLWSRRNRPGASVPLGTGTTTTEVDLPAIRRVAASAALAARTRSWRRMGDVRDESPVTIAVSLDGDATPDRTIATFAALAVERGAELVVGMTRAVPHWWAEIGMLTLWVPRAVAVPLPAGTEALPALAGEVHGRGRVLLVSGGAAVAGRDAAALLDQDDALSAPLWLDHDGTIAGLAPDPYGTGRLLAGHPVEDARRAAVDGAITLAALAGGVAAADAATFRAAGAAAAPGEDAAAALSRVAQDAGLPTSVRVDAIARATSPVGEALRRPDRPDAGAGAVLARIGFVRGDDGGVSRPPRTTEAEVGRIPVLRWAIRTAAPAGPAGESWGDTHFARGLAAALRRLGQEVVIDAYPARARSSSHLDDVTLVLRGPRPVPPPRHGTSILWVISHPDEITAAEVERFDHVFAASASWAARASARFERSVGTLLQCTDTTLFRPTGRERGGDLVFVGTARGIARPSVVAPLGAGIPVRVYGPDWRGYIPASAIVATGVAHADLPAVYESAGAVLNDHWPMMRAEGFVGNRLFDVVAAGGRAISDRVDGIDAIFRGAVATYETVAELLDLVSGDLDDVFPTEERRAAVAADVRREHSFDARANALLTAVLGTPRTLGTAR